MKTKILIIAGYYLPGVKGGGPIQSLKNMVDNLSEYYDFYLLAADRDLGDLKPYNNITADRWVKKNNIKICYTNIRKKNLYKYYRFIIKVNCDVLYLNSFFSPQSIILTFIFNFIVRRKRVKIIIAPRGQFSEGALNIKKNKKRIYLKVVKLINIFKNITWHATSIEEMKDISKNIKNCENIIIANNFTENYEKIDYRKMCEKDRGKLRVVFISRIHPKKNLKYAIELMEGLKNQIVFDIYGPIEDRIYWSECLNIMRLLPTNISIQYKGAVKHSDVISIFRQYHVFLFPTLGENYGHVISEAMIGGCVPIISDQTPWKDLYANGIGWDISLKQPNKFIEALTISISLSNKEYSVMSKNAYEFSKSEAIAYKKDRYFDLFANN